MEILGVTLEQEWHDICDSSTLYMHPGDETFGRNDIIFVTAPHFTCTLVLNPSLKPYEYEEIVSMGILGVTLEQE